MSKPHKYCELIKAWADGATIQALNIDGITWIDVPNPTWVNATYRIKPMTKPSKRWRLMLLDLLHLQGGMTQIGSNICKNRRITRWSVYT